MAENMVNEQPSGPSSMMMFLLGAAVGAAVAILYAPMPGHETRAQIADTAGQLKDRAMEIKGQVADKASELKDSAAQSLNAVTERIQSTVSQTQQSGHHVADAVRNEIPEVENAVQG